MGRKLTSDHRLDNTEVTRRFHDRSASIDGELDYAISQIDWKRRRKAEKNLVDWVNTYCIGLLLDDPPPKRGEEVLAEMQKALNDHSNYCILMSRGSGKSSYVECSTVYAMAAGLQKFTVIISANARASGNMMQDIWRMISEPDTPFAQDYPHVCLPFQLCNGSLRRRQLYHGKSTELSKNAGQIIFARLQDDKGKELPTSGSIISVRGISSGIRGMKKGTLRPSLVLLDDLQDSETAENAESVEKLLNIIKKDVMCLGGKQRLSILQTATPICPEDLVEHIKADTNWKTTTFPGIIKWPTNEQLWNNYFSIYDRENAADAGHSESLQFYKDNRQAMDEGSEVFNPSRFSKDDGHISALQKMLEQRHVIGAAAFAAEYQMQPQKYSYSLDITPKIVSSRIGNYEQGVVPDGFIFVAASTDLNVSYAMTTTIVAFKSDMTAVVIEHIITKLHIDQKLSNAEYNTQLYNALADLGRQLKSLNIPINGWGIDSTGSPFEAVTLFAKNSMTICGIPCCAMSGKASHVFNGFVRSRLRDEINRTVLCGDAAEQLKSGSGKKYMFWDSDAYREMAQKAFLAEVGAPGGCSLYHAGIEEHSEFSTQFCNERLKFVKHRQDGRSEYFWKTAEPHDYLDSVAQAYAVAGSQGISGANFIQAIPKKNPQRRFMIPKPKIRII